MTFVDLDSIQFYQPSVKPHSFRRGVSTATATATANFAGRVDFPGGRQWSDESVKSTHVVAAMAQKPLGFFDDAGSGVRNCTIDDDAPQDAAYSNPIVENDQIKFDQLEELPHDVAGLGALEPASWICEQSTTPSGHGFGDYCEGDDLLSWRPRSESIDLINGPTTNGGWGGSPGLEDVNRGIANSLAEECGGELDTSSRLSASTNSFKEATPTFLRNHHPTSPYPLHYHDNAAPSVQKVCTLSLDGEHNGPTSTARTEYDQCADTHTARDEGRTEGEDYTKATNRRRLAYARRSGKKRSRPIHRQTPGPKRRLKRLRFTALPSSSEESENNDSDISTYTAPKSSKTSMTGPEADEQSRRSPTRTAVVYQQQSWEGVIMDEKYTKQGRGRPRKQYLIQWEPSWVDAAHLNAPELTRNWNEKVI